jgi:translation elongation factor EF-G
MKRAGAAILEPVMKVEVTIPAEFQGAVMGGIIRRRGVILNNEIRQVKSISLYLSSVFYLFRSVSFGQPPVVSRAKSECARVFVAGGESGGTVRYPASENTSEGCGTLQRRYSLIVFRLSCASFFRGSCPA